jgi:hypothetical protein
VDVVTFLQAPTAFCEPIGADAEALEHDAAKVRFRVDAYFVELDVLTPRELTGWAAYWYSMWSHRRNQAWKGFLQIELAPHEDAEARVLLSERERAGENP